MYQYFRGLIIKKASILIAKSYRLFQVKVQGITTVLVTNTVESSKRNLLPDLLIIKENKIIKERRTQIKKVLIIWKKKTKKIIPTKEVKKLPTK